MWVWHQLGFDRVAELDAGELTPLGLRCRVADGVGDNDISVQGPLGLGPSMLEDQHANSLELRSPSWTRTLSRSSERPTTPVPGNSIVSSEPSKRLALLPVAPSAGEGDEEGVWPAFRNARVLIPGVVDIHRAGPAVVLDATTGAKLESYASVQAALAGFFQLGGGSFVFRAPMVMTELSEDVAAECCEYVAPDEWPMYVSGAVLGAELRVTLETGEGGPLGGDSMATLRDSSLAPALIVPGDGFDLRIEQRGGPPLDPTRLHKRGIADIAKEFERWARKVVAQKPGTWCTLSALTRRGSTNSEKIDHIHDAALNPSQADVGVDLVMLAMGTVEVHMEPFELSYGPPHIVSMQRMLEDEVADILCVAPEQVMCGNFHVVGQAHNSGPGKRHVRKSTVLVSFALLHADLIELRTKSEAQKMPKMPYPHEQRKPKTAEPEVAAPRLDETVASLGQTLNPSQLAATTAASEKASTGRVAKSLSQTLKTGKGLAKTLSKSLNASTSLPDLLKTQEAKALQDKQNRGLVVMSPVNRRHAEGSETLQPDLLLRKLIAAIGDKKHPIRRRQDLFPMLTRVLRGSIRTDATVIASTDVIKVEGLTLGQSLRKSLKLGRTAAKLKEFEASASVLIPLREDALLRNRSEAHRLDKVQEFRLLSPSELLNKMESSLSIPGDLAACLDVLLQWTDSNKDATGKDDQCIKLKQHNVLTRLVAVMKYCRSDKVIAVNCITIVGHLTRHDIGAVDVIMEKQLAPELIAVFENFPADHSMQTQAAAILRRLYVRARDMSKSGPRVITLGKCVDETWTYRGVDRILTIMSQFEYDEVIQLDALLMLCTLAELLCNSGQAKATFKRLTTALDKHGNHSDIARLGILIIAKMGPSFLAHEHRGVRVIVDAMERHRSNVELQRAGAHAFFSLAKTEAALQVCRKMGTIGAMLSAMIAHTKDSQVLQESTRALEKHCPIAMYKVFQACGDLAATIPPVFWSLDPIDVSGRGSTLRAQIGDMHASGNWHSSTIDDFHRDFLSSPTHQSISDGASTAAIDEIELDRVQGYRRAGIRDELDALDSWWALPGPAKTGLRKHSNESGPIRGLAEDIAELEKQGCDVNHLRAKEPNEAQLKKLVDSLVAGAVPSKKGKLWGAHDGELVVGLLSSYAWHSTTSALKLAKLGAPKAFVTWLKADHLQGTTVADRADNFPLMRTVLGGISCLCRHFSVECAEQLLNADLPMLIMGFRKCGPPPSPPEKDPVPPGERRGPNLEWTRFQGGPDFTSHLDISIRRNAMRCVARLIPAAAERQAIEPAEGQLPPESGQFPQPELWKLILSAMTDDDDTIRTCASACALEAVCCSMLTESDAPVEELIQKLLLNLEKTTPFVGDAPTSRQSYGALPLLIAFARLVSEDPPFHLDGIERRRKLEDQLLKWLRRWLPAGSPAEGDERPRTSIDCACATAAARSLEAMSINQAHLGAEDLEALLTQGCGDAAAAMPGMQEACVGALEPAIRRERNVEVLALLFSTQLPRSTGGFRLAKVELLEQILNRIFALLRDDPHKMSDRLLSALRKALPLIPKDGPIALCTEIIESGRASEESHAMAAQASASSK